MTFSSSNETKYRFADFTTSNYSRLVNLVQDKSLFKTFTEYQNHEQFVLWRHDVDFSVHRAKRLAEIEREENVKSTYFLLLHSEFYNLLEKEIRLCVEDILKYGHHIGIHFDPHYYNIKSEDELIHYLSFEREVFSEIFQTEVQVFSFHITNSLTESFEKPEYAGLINTYSAQLKKNVKYCSDSNGYWRFQSLEDFLNENLHNPRIQVLTHPSLWQETVMSPRQRVWRCIDGRSEFTRRWYNDTLSQCNRENIDW